MTPASACLLAALSILSTAETGTPASPPGASAAAAPAPPRASARDSVLESPPPGPPEDRALWIAGRDVSNEVRAERGRATRLQVRAKGYGYSQRLDALAAAGAIAPERAKELQARMEEELGEVVEILLRPWPVDPTRVCGYDVLLFGSALHARSAVRVAEARGPLQKCIARAEIVVRALRRADDELEAAMVEIDRLLAPPGAAPAAAAGARPPPPSVREARGP
jgi:hypothetical protein